MERFETLGTRVEAITTKTAIDPAVIIAVISAIIKMIADCQNPPATLADSGSVVWDITVNRAMRDNKIWPISKDGKALKAALRDQAAAMTPDDTAAFLSLCQ